MKYTINSTYTQKNARQTILQKAPSRLQPHGRRFSCWADAHIACGVVY
jgi:hypothetical protein